MVVRGRDGVDRMGATAGVSAVGPAVEARDLIIEVADLRSGVVQPQVGHI